MINILLIVFFLCPNNFYFISDCLTEKAEITNKTKPKVIDICLGSGEKAKITGVKWSPNGQMLAACAGKFNQEPHYFKKFEFSRKKEGVYFSPFKRKM